MVLDQNQIRKPNPNGKEVSLMKRSMLTVMVLAVSVIFVAAAMAAEQKAPASAAPIAPKIEKYSGVIDRVDAARKDFAVKAGKEEITFSSTAKTKITEGKKTLAIADLKKGQEVAVEYVKEGNKSVAETVSVSAPKTVGMKEKTPSSTKNK
jgi:Cu/Ag efflux protein CusF